MVWKKLILIVALSALVLFAGCGKQATEKSASPLTGNVVADIPVQEKSNEDPNICQKDLKAIVAEARSARDKLDNVEEKITYAQDNQLGDDVVSVLTKEKAPLQDEVDRLSSLIQQYTTKCETA